MVAVGAEFMKAAPDTYFEILEQDIDLMADGETIITVEYCMEGTKVMDLEGFPEEGEEKVTLTASESESMDYGIPVDENTEKKMKKAIEKEKNVQVTSTISGFQLSPLFGVPVETVLGVERFGIRGISEYPTIIDIPFARTTFYVNPDKKIYRIVAVK